jgi:hypothetical protein
MSKAYDAQDDFAKSLDVGYAAIRERMAKGGPGWTPKSPSRIEHLADGVTLSFDHPPAGNVGAEYI